MIDPLLSTSFVVAQKPRTETRKKGGFRFAFSFSRESTSACFSNIAARFLVGTPHVLVCGSEPIALEKREI